MMMVIMGINFIFYLWNGSDGDKEYAPSPFGFVPLGEGNENYVHVFSIKEGHVLSREEMSILPNKSLDPHS